MPEDKKGNRNAMDPAITLYIQNILIEETCGVETDDSNPDKGYIKPSRISELLKEKYGVNCDRAIVKKYVTDLDNYYKNCRSHRYGGLLGKTYALETSRNGNRGHYRYKLHSIFDSKSAIQALTLANTFDEYIRMETLVLHAFGSEKRGEIVKTAKPYLKLHNNEINPEAQDLYSAGSSMLALINTETIEDAIEKKRSLICTKKLSDPYRYSDWLETGIEIFEHGNPPENATKVDDGYQIEEVVYPVGIEKARESGLLVIAISEQEYSRLEQDKLPAWLDNKNHIWPKGAEWPKEIAWPKFESFNLEHYDFYGLGEKLPSKLAKISEKVGTLQRISKKLDPRKVGGNPVFVKVRLKESLLKPERLPERNPNTGEKYSSKTSLKEFAKATFGNYPRFEMIDRATFQFIASENECSFLFQKFMKAIEFLEPKQIAETQRRCLKAMGSRL